MRTEILVFIAFMLALICFFCRVSSNAIWVVLTGSLMVEVYFPGGLYFLSDRIFKRQNMLMSALGGIALCFAPMGVLFKSLDWPGSDNTLILGMAGSVNVCVVAWFLRPKASAELYTYFTQFFIRSVTWFVLSLLFYVTPLYTFIEWSNGDDPERVRLQIQTHEYPENKAYQRAFETYVRKKDSLEAVQRHR